MNLVAEKVASAHRHLADRPTKVTTIANVPSSYDALTPEWFTDLFCPSSDARVTDCILGDRDTGSTNRRRIFLRYNAEGDALDLPSSVFCKGTFELANKTLLAQTGAIHGEISFYQHVRPLLDIETPFAFYAAYDPETFSSLVVLRDFLNTAKFGDHHLQITREQAEQQMALLARLHGRFCAADHAATSDIFQTWTDRFRGWEAAGTRTSAENGFAQAEAVIPPRLFARAVEIWPATQRAVAEHGRLPLTLTHGDVHLKNWYILYDGRVGLADWQAISKAHWSRDIAYTLATSLTIDCRRAWERELLAFYLDRLRAEGGPDVDLEDGWTWYRRQMFHALASWTIPLAPTSSMPDMQPRDTSLEFVKRCAQAIDDLGSLDSFD